MDTSADHARVVLAVVRGAHGVKGLLRVIAFTEDPKNIAAYGPLYTEDGRLFGAHVKGLLHGDVLIALDGVTDRTQAQAMKSLTLSVPRSALPPLANGDLYRADCIGLPVHAPDHGVLGTLTGFLDYGAGPVAEITRPDGTTVLLPFNDTFWPHIDATHAVAILPPDW